MSWEPAYCTAAELAAYVKMTATVDEPRLAVIAAAASREVDRLCGRQFGLLDAPEARRYTMRYDGRRRAWFADIDDTFAVPTLVAYDSAGDQTYATELDDTVLAPSNAAQRGRPWTRLWVTSGAAGYARDALEVTAQWGWTEVPDAVHQATLIQGARLVKRREAPFGITGAGQDSPGLRLFSRVDPDVEVLLQPYARTWGAR